MNAAELAHTLKSAAPTPTEAQRRGLHRAALVEERKDQLMEQARSHAKILNEWFDREIHPIQQRLTRVDAKIDGTVVERRREEARKADERAHAALSLNHRLAMLADDGIFTKDQSEFLADLIDLLVRPTPADHSA